VLISGLLVERFGRK